MWVGTKVSVGKTEVMKVSDEPTPVNVTQNGHQLNEVYTLSNSLAQGSTSTHHDCKDQIGHSTAEGRVSALNTVKKSNYQ